ncbi:MAG: hypothetical protein JW704_13830, partial [Anaerolineaceae bacterium]|nr:hypothetical protein [Anaerolineaceae bacterium]
MAIQTKLAIISLIIPVLLSGCRASVDNARDTDDGVFPWPGDETQPGSQPSFDPGWYQTEWPDYIPDDIPEMEGNIRLVMDAPGSHVRIFYEDVTKNQLEQYLRLLEEEGFTLVYQVYVREGFPDNSEERLKKGDYDAVDITRGEYHMKISYGEDDITYDIYKSGFPAGLPASAGSEWPAELVNVVPKPERCALQSAA